MKATIWLTIASLGASGCYSTAMANVQWRTDNNRSSTRNDLERALAGCEVVAETANDTSGAELIFWGFNYRVAYTECMKSEGWLPRC